MKSTLTKTTLANLERELATILENANQHHIAAISYYPDEVYKTYDAEAVRLRKEYAVLSNLTDIKYIEMGVNGLDKEIAYLEARAKELENFYFKVNDTDKPLIENSLNSIKNDIWELKKTKNNIMSTEFEIHQ